MPNSSAMVVTSATSGTTVSAATSSVLLCQYNPDRKAVWIFNDSTVALYVKVSGSASTSDFSFKIPSDALYESTLPVPFGEYTGVWTAETGSAMVTEIS